MHRFPLNHHQMPPIANPAYLTNFGQFHPGQLFTPPPPGHHQANPLPPPMFLPPHPQQTFDPNHIGQFHRQPYPVVTHASPLPPAQFSHHYPPPPPNQTALLPEHFGYPFNGHHTQNAQPQHLHNPLPPMLDHFARPELMNRPPPQFAPQMSFSHVPTQAPPPPHPHPTPLPPNSTNMYANILGPPTPSNYFDMMPLINPVPILGQRPPKPVSPPMMGEAPRPVPPPRPVSPPSQKRSRSPSPKSNYPVPRGDLYSPEYESSLTRKNFLPTQHSPPRALSPSNPPNLEGKSKNQKKALPAWIREGLERLEKEKLDKYEEDQRESESDEDSQPEYQEQVPVPVPLPVPRLTAEQLTEFVAKKTRTVLTELLLAVVDSEAEQICKDVLAKETRSSHKKGPFSSTKPKVTSNDKGSDKRKVLDDENDANTSASDVKPNIHGNLPGIGDYGSSEDEQEPVRNEEQRTKSNHTSKKRSRERSRERRRSKERESERSRDRSDSKRHQSSSSRDEEHRKSRDQSRRSSSSRSGTSHHRSSHHDSHRSSHKSSKSSRRSKSPPAKSRHRN